MIYLTVGLRSILFHLMFLLIMATAGYTEQIKDIFLKEDFNNLDNWKPLLFPKITRHSSYTIISHSDNNYLKAESNNSASGLIYKKEFSVYEYPNLRWAWKVDNIFMNGNAKVKEGDDYPIRIYIIFKYEPEKAAFFDKLKYKSAKIIYGEYPPDSSLNYIWANKDYSEKMLTSPYTDKSKMIILKRGNSRVGTWEEEGVNILQDYKKAFSKKPPATASIAIMNDSDNTGERAVSYIDYIELFRIN